MSTNDVLVLLSVVLALIVVLVLAAALIEVRRLEGAVKAINAQFDVILAAMPGIAGKAAIVAERRPR
jgi:ABC-type transporter Mla subunit MlaD